MLIGVRMLNFVKEQLRLPLEKKFLWTDNQCVLHWIMSKRPLTTFVQNRVKETTERKDLSFCRSPSKSRGFSNKRSLSTRSGQMRTLVAWAKVASGQ